MKDIKAEILKEFRKKFKLDYVIDRHDKLAGALTEIKSTHEVTDDTLEPIERFLRASLDQVFREAYEKGYQDARDRYRQREALTKLKGGHVADTGKKVKCPCDCHPDETPCGQCISRHE